MRRLILCASLLVPICGCDREVESEKTVEVKDDGTVTKEETKVSETAEGGVKKEETKTVDKP